MTFLRMTSLLVPLALLSYVFAPSVFQTTQVAALGSVTAPVSSAPSVTGTAPAAAQGLAGVTSAPAALTGGGCYENNVVSVSGGSIPIGATPVPVPKGCPATVCFIPAPGGTPVCMLKTAAQGLSLGVGSLVTALTVGNLVTSLAQQSSSSSNGGSMGMGSGYGIPSSYTYGSKPTCSSFVSSQGISHVPPKTSVQLSWTLGGGTPESQTITPDVGIVADDTGGAARRVSIEAPMKTTAYTLSVHNRSGYSTCKTIVYVAPQDPEIATASQSEVVSTTTSTTTAATTTTVKEALTDPLSLQKNTKSYDDIGVQLVEKKEVQHEESIPPRRVSQIQNIGKNVVVVEPLQHDPTFFNFVEHGVEEALIEDPLLDDEIHIFTDQPFRGAQSSVRSANDALFAENYAAQRETHISGMLSYDDVSSPILKPKSSPTFFSWLIGVLCVWCAQ